jgi:glutaconate CoA-transferase subunit A
MDKRSTLTAAAERIESGTTLALGGMTLYRRPMAFVRALLARSKRDQAPDELTLLAFTAGLESDLLVGAGLVKRTRTCYFGLEIFGLAPMFTHYANRGELLILEETEASLALGLRAQMAGIGFMPGRAWLGTDLPRLRPDVATIRDPYSGEELMAFPAIRPDVAVIHALQADPHGNARIGGNRGIDEELVAPFVDMVVLAPQGAAPTSCHPLYPLDGQAMLEYTEQVNDPASFAAYLERWLAE